MIGYPHVAGFLRLAHQVQNPLVFRNIEVEISFHPAIVYVGRHGVPYTARSQDGQSHHQLATADAFKVNVFVNGAFVGRFNRAHLHGRSFFLEQASSGIVLMRRGRKQVIIRRSSAVDAFKNDLFIFFAHVEASHKGQFVHFVTYFDSAIAAHVDDAQLSSFQKIITPQYGIRR